MTPEPVDESPAAGVEVRGGDRDEDFMPQYKGGWLTQQQQEALENGADDEDE
jgi:hypothetical protein